MANTPYNDLKSEDILSAHISGLQHDINKIQNVLNLQTSSESNHALHPVNDQEDPSLRFRIYEGTIRNWVTNPAPVIYRNGVSVNPSEYYLAGPYGAVVFHEQQNANDTFTADFSYINSNSKTISDIKNDIDSIPIPATRMVLASGMWASHNRDGWADIWSNTYMAANIVDVFPLPLGEPTTLDAIAVRVDQVAGNNGAMAIYKDNGNCYPSELVANGGTFSTTTAGWKINDINVTLDAGLYWLVRNQDAASAYAGYRYHEVIPIGMDIQTIPWNPEDQATTNNAGYYGGYRLDNSSIGLDGNWPSTFPSGASPFSRVRYCSVFVRKA